MIERVLSYVAILVLAGLLVQTCVQKKQDEQRLEDNVRITQDSVKHYRDKSGQLVAQREAILIRENDLKSQAVALGIDKDRLEKQVGKLSNLVSYYKGELQAKGTVVSEGKDTVLVEVVRGDTTRREAKVFEYANAFLFLHQLYLPDSNRLITEYEYKVEVEVTTYRRRDNPFNFLSKKRLYADVRLSDPNASIINARSVVIDLPAKRWYERTWVHLVAGAVGGIFIATKL